MTLEELKKAGWFQIKPGMLRRGASAIDHFEDDPHGCVANLYATVSGVEHTPYGWGRTEDIAIADLGTRKLTDGRTVREWALAPRGDGK